MAQNETSVSGDVVFQDGDDLSETNLTRTAAKSNLTDYVERGLGLNVDGAAGTVDIGSGHAIVQDGINAYDLFPNQQTGIALPGPGTNYIYVAIQSGSDDDVYYHIDEDQTPPTDPSILIGTADASAGTSAVLNRRPDQEIGDADIDQLVAALDANGQDINNVGSLSTEQIQIAQTGQIINASDSDNSYGVESQRPSDTEKLELLPDLTTGDKAGLLIARQAASTALLTVTGNANAVNLIADPSGGFDTTEGNGGTMNIYWDSTNSRYELENQVGSSRTVTMTFLR